MNYEFNRSCLEIKTFLAYYQIITYSQISYRNNSFHFSSHGKPFLLPSSFSRGILVISSRNREVVFG